MNLIITHLREALTLEMLMLRLLTSNADQKLNTAMGPSWWAALKHRNFDTQSNDGIVRSSLKRCQR